MPNTYAHKVVCFGEILWDILPTGAMPGGAPMNVAFHLHKLGINPTLITRVGVDERGKELLELLRQLNISIDHIQLDHDTATGIVNAMPNSQGEMKYDIVTPAAWDNIHCDVAMQSAVEDASHFVFGSLITRNKTSRDTLYQLLEIAHTKVLDINLRSPYFNLQLVEELLQKADILKMNIEELKLISGWFSDYEQITDQIEWIRDKFKIPTVMVTMGADGAMINLEGKWFRHPGYIVKVQDTVGSGDSFLAAFLFKLLNNRPIEEALTFASGLGAFIASKSGAWPQYEMAQIQTFINSYPQQRSFVQ
jgi:fructokinase